METTIDHAGNFPAQGILGWTVFTLDNDQPRLIDALPVGRRRMINRLIGAVQEKHPDLLPRAFNTLRALLSHCWHHSNRIWASLVRLGQLIVGKDDQSKDKGAKKAQRAVEDLVQAGLIRKITDPAELLAGPGEHTFIARGGKKKSEHPVTHYDVSALLDYVDPDDVRDWDALFGEGRIYLVSPPAAQEARPVYTEPAPDDLDPFQEDYPEQLAAQEALAVPASLEAAGAPLPATPPSSVIFNKNTSHHPCNVTDEFTNNGGEPGGRGAEPSVAAIEKFGGTNLSTIKGKGSARKATPVAVEKQADFGIDIGYEAREQMELLTLLTKSRAEGGRGFDLRGAQTFKAEFSEKFVREVVEYVIWQEEQKNEFWGPGKHLNTARKFEKEWPFRFREHLARQKSSLLAARQKAETARRDAAALTAQLDGIAEPLRAVWSPLLQALKAAPGMVPGFWVTTISQLRVASLDCETITIHGPDAARTRTLTNKYTDAFIGALTRLLGRAVTVRFAAPEVGG